MGEQGAGQPGFRKTDKHFKYLEGEPGTSAPAFSAARQELPQSWRAAIASRGYGLY
jgi:hypothetical protein